MKISVSNRKSNAMRMASTIEIRINVYGIVDYGTRQKKYLWKRFATSFFSR